MSGFEKRAVATAIERATAAGLPIPQEIRTIEAKLEHGTADGYLTAWRDHHPGQELPDEALTCCWGAQIYGPERCTCWKPVYDVDQQPPAVTVDIADRTKLPARRTRCGDCAFRRDSPEHADNYSAEQLHFLAAAGEPFWCHQGMRRPTLYRHPALGDVPGYTDDWRPLQDNRNGVPYQADGTPGLLCAGWASEHRKHTGGSA